MVVGGGFGWLDDDAIVAYSVSFVEGIDPATALERTGAETDSLAELSAAEADALSDQAGGDPVLHVGQCGRWSVLVEHDANKGVNERTLLALSAETRAVSVFSSASGMDLLCYAENGHVDTVVETSIPANRFGDQPDRFLSAMAEVGLLPGEEPDSVRVATMTLVQAVFGVAVDEE